MTTNTDKIDTKLIDQLLKDYQSPEDILGENGLLKQFTKAALERAMSAELTTHLGYERHDPAGKNSGNSRNGKSRKTITGDFGELPLEVPRDARRADPRSLREPSLSLHDLVAHALKKLQPRFALLGRSLRERQGSQTLPALAG